jgi:hypothetical protein
MNSVGKDPEGSGIVEWIAENTLNKVVVTFTDPINFALHGRQAAWERIRKACYFRAGRGMPTGIVWWQVDLQGWL